jgi:hypothetical protein
VATAAEIASGRMSAIQHDVISDNEIVGFIVSTDTCFIDQFFGDPVAVRPWNSALMATPMNGTGQKIQ